MSSSTTSATRKSRSDCDAVLTAAAAAFSHDWVLVPISSTTVYTLSAMAASVSSIAPCRRYAVVKPAAGGLALDGQPALERLGAIGQLDAGQRRHVRPHVVELLGEGAHAVGAGERQDLHGAQHAEGLARTVEEAAAGVTRDAGGQGVHGLLPAAAVGAEAHTRLRAQRRDGAQRR